MRAFSEDHEAVQDVGVHVEGADDATSAAVAFQFEDSGFVDFAVAGTAVCGEFRCTDCGYGAIVQRALPRCPMCGGAVWESRGPLAPRLAG